MIVEVRDAEEGRFFARALGHSIFTGADTWDELRSNVVAAVGVHFNDAPAPPRIIQLHYVRDELVPFEAA